MIALRSPAEIDSIARAGGVVDRILNELVRAAIPGVATRDLDALARRRLDAEGALALFPAIRRGEGPAFPGAVCVCVNEEATHGVPGARALRAGDLVTIDLGASLGGWCADASRCTVVGGADHDAADGSCRTRPLLVAAARGVTGAGIDAITPGARWSDVARAIRNAAAHQACRLVPGFSGHGIGRALHEPPRASVFPGPAEDFVLRPGMVLTVEPLVAGRGAVDQPTPPVAIRSDGWTVATTDGSDACQHEETVAVVRGGCRVLTRGPEVVSG